MVALITGQIMSMFFEVIQKSEFIPEKPSTFVFRKSIVICGLNKKLINILSIIRSVNKNIEIVVVDENADKIKIENDIIAKNIFHFKGDPADRSQLEKIINNQNCTALILSDDKYMGLTSDSRALEIALAIEAKDESIHTIIELNNKTNEKPLRSTKIDEWINNSEFSTKLLSQCTLKNLSAETFLSLLEDSRDNRYFNNIMMCDIPKTLNGKKYLEIIEGINARITDEIIFIGFALKLPSVAYPNIRPNSNNKEYFLQINPKLQIDSNVQNESKCFQLTAETKLFNYNKSQKESLYSKSSDQLIYIGSQEINLSKIF
jgi:hypothetical protein